MALFGASHESFRARLRDYIESELTPCSEGWEQNCSFPRRVFEEFGSRGFFGLNRDPAFGGQGLDFGFNVALAEELPRSKMMGLTISLLGQTNICAPLLERLGTDRQKME